MFIGQDVFKDEVRYRQRGNEDEGGANDSGVRRQVTLKQKHDDAKAQGKGGDRHDDHGFLGMRQRAGFSQRIVHVPRRMQSAKENCKCNQWRQKHRRCNARKHFHSAARVVVAARPISEHQAAQGGGHGGGAE